jgi:predicted DNA-binding protein
MSYQLLAIRMPPELHEELRERAVAEDRPMASIVRTALKAYLGEFEAGESVRDLAARGRKCGEMGDRTGRNSPAQRRS